MKRTLLFAAATLILASPAFAEEPAPPSDGLMVDAIDQTVKPCDDFYHFACNGWLKAHPVPPDQAAWDVGSALIQRNDERLRTILEKAAKDNAPDTKQLGAYWTACMDETAIAKKGLDPLAQELAAIDAISDAKSLAAEIGRLQRLGVAAFFTVSSEQDLADATKMILVIDQGGIGLPDRSYYLKTDKQTATTRTQYHDHLVRLAGLAGLKPDEAEQAAKATLAIETSLAKASLSDEARVDPHATYHPTPRAALDTLAPGFPWADYFAAVKAPPVDSLDIAVPGFFTSFAKLVTTAKLDDIKLYLRDRLVERSAAMLPPPLAEESFNFYGATLDGAKQQRPRWRRCVAATDADLGEALGKLYVRDVFGPDAKEAITKLVHNLRAAFAEDLKTIPWMGQETRDKALQKLAATVDKIGYPDKWRDYSALEIRPDEALGNRLRAATFESDRELAKIGKPVDRDEWSMTPPTVNAYYDAQNNSVNFPAGILQPPYFDVHWDDAVNYGSTGSTIGHEMTHGFDNSGRMFDGKGNLADWWTAKDAGSFTSRAQCLVQEYGSFSPLPGVKLNGPVTLTENTADNGGTRLSYAAFEKAIAGRTIGRTDGYTPEQRFFIAYAQSFCENQTAASARLQAETDSHSTAEFRVNGVVRNMTEFRDAFACKTGDRMAPARTCRVW